MNLTIKERMRLLGGDGMWHNQSLGGKIPRIHLSDGPHGLRKQDDKAKKNNDSKESTCFPTASAIASSWDLDVVKLMADAIAMEAFNEEVSILLGPGINMKRSPLCGRNFEYYAEDPFLAGKLGSSFVKAVEEVGVGTSLKHFCANSQETLRMTSNSMVDERALREIYLKAFEMVVKEAHPATIMASYNRINGLYATENSYLLTDILRKEWKYEGLVVSDWGASVHFKDAILAGMDLEMPDSHKFHYKKLLKAYKKKEISDQDIIIPSNRVLELVNKYSIENRNRKEKYDISENHKKAIWAEIESAVLLENDGILPLKEKRVVLVGGLATNVRFQGGGSSHIHTSHVLTAVEAFEKEGYQVSYFKGYSTENEDVDLKLEDVAKEQIKANDIVLFFGGLTDLFEGEGYDRKNLDMPKNQIHLWNELYKINKNMIYISFSGSPYFIPFRKEARAILHMYLGGEGVMEALVKLVNGEVNPSGKLAESWPLSSLDTPSYETFAKYKKDIMYKESIFIGYRYYDTFDVPLQYSFGYGKSYTSFSYSNLSLEKKYSGGKLIVSYDITNAGTMPGKEISMVFVSRKNPTFLSPKRELKGFDKVYLMPGETKRVTIELDESSFSIYGENGFVMPSGYYDISVQSSINDVKLTEEIKVMGICYEKDDMTLYPSYFDISKKLKNIPDEEFKVLYGKEFSHFDEVKKGQYDITNSLGELSKHSLKAKILLSLAKKIIYTAYKDKPKNDPEVMMTIEAIEMGDIDCVFCQGGIPYRIAESIVLSANGHRFKALHKLIWG